MRILGLSAFYHDSAAVLLHDGEIIAAAQEERFSRKKHDPGFPRDAARYCLREGAISLAEVDYVVFYEQPFLKFRRQLVTYLTSIPNISSEVQLAMPGWLISRLLQKGTLRKELNSLDRRVNWTKRLLFVEHHASHAASAFFASPFSNAAILIMDGVGEWATTSVAAGRGNSIEITKEIYFPHSLGLLYSAFTSFCGFRVNSGEYKLMGLAPYGKPIYAQRIIDHLVDIKNDGSFRLNMKYFNYLTGLSMTNDEFVRLFNVPQRAPDDPLSQPYLDLAASIQVVLEQIVLRLVSTLAIDTGDENLCVAGGVALNCVMNSKVLRHGGFKRIWIQPAAGDAGGALGAALSASYQIQKRPRVLHGDDAMKGTYLGPQFSNEDIQLFLHLKGARFRVLSDQELIDSCTDALVLGHALGWMEGRMEFGPRALGARSILADPRSPTMQSVLNVKVKKRESFRPFAPSVLREDLEEWFVLDCDSPYMLLVADVLDKRRLVLNPEDRALAGLDRLRVLRSEIPAVTHVDYSARIQTVHAETNPLYHRLISAFKMRTGCPVLVNTSFNVRGEPIVCSPEDAFSCFMRTGIEALAIGNCFLRKSDQDQRFNDNHSQSFDPD